MGQSHLIYLKVRLASIITLVVTVKSKSSGIVGCFLQQVAGKVGGFYGCLGVLTVTYLNGFSPVCVRMWLLSVVAPAKARPQYPHLKGRSLECVTTWFLNSDG